MTRAADPDAGAASLAGLTVLVVEDDYLVAKEMANVLREHHALVLGPIPDVTRSRALIAETAPDCVLLDINLKGQLVFELARDLLDRRIPVILATGYDLTFVPETLRHLPYLRKPIDSRALIDRIRRQTESLRRGSASSP